MNFWLFQVGAVLCFKGTLVHPKEEDFHYSTTVSINDEYKTPIFPRGDFETIEFPRGDYILQVDSLEFVFPRIRIIVDDKISCFEAPLGMDYDSFGKELEYPLKLSPLYALDYTPKAEGFSLLSLLTNPMMLISIVSLLIVFIFPKLKDNLIDPEIMAQIEKEQAEKGASAQPPMPQIPDFASNIADWFSQPTPAKAPSKNKKKTK